MNRRRPAAEGRPRWSYLARGLLALLGIVAVLLACAGVGYAAPRAPAVDATCAQKAAGSVAWCMPWAVHVDTPPAGGSSHWVTQCSKATTDDDRQACDAASVTLDAPPPDGTPSVLMDGPSSKDGLTALVKCGLFGEQQTNEKNPTRFILWRDKHTRCAQQVGVWTAAAFEPNPQKEACGKVNYTCQIKEGTKDAVASGIRSGIQGLVDAIVQGEVFLLSKLAGLVFTETSIASPSTAFYSVYNSVAGVVVILIFLFFIVSTIINGLRFRGGRTPLATIGGLVKAILGVTFAGGIAYMIVYAWDQAAVAVLNANASKPMDASHMVTAMTNLSGSAATLLLAGLFGLLGIFGLVLLLFIMMFRGLLATGAALFGAVAMAGFAYDETQHWPRKWFWTTNALASSKVWIVEFWIYGGRATYGSDDLTTVLQSMLMIWLMVAAPFILLRTTSIWDGYLSDINAHGMLSALGGPLMIGSNIADGLRSGWQGGGEAADDAVAMMDANTATTPTNPAGPIGQATGIGNGPGQDVAEAASRGQDGEDVGEPLPEASGTQGEDTGTEDTDSEQGPNAQEADGIRAAHSSGEQAMSTGELTAPGDSSGDGGTLPLTPQAAAGTDPAGLAHGDDSPAGDTGDPATAAVLGEPQTDTGGGPGSPDSGVAANGDPAAAAPDAKGAGMPASRSAAGENATDREHSDDHASVSGQSGSEAATGGAQGASAVADVPIVPL